MKNVAIICAALLVVGMVASASAADGISKSTLSNMGFANAQTMTDQDGLAVRGKGWVFMGGTAASVGGTSSAAFFDINFGVSTASNHYDSSASHDSDPSKAKGNSMSNAGIVFTQTGDLGNFTKSTMVVSGGSAFAFSR
jgi:hypothetical protein